MFIIMWKYTIWKFYILMRPIWWHCEKCNNQFSSVAQLCPTLQSHGLQHARPPCPSSTPGDFSNSSPLSWWCHPTISSSVIPFSSCPQSFPASGSFPMSQLFASGGQSIGHGDSTMTNACKGLVGREEWMDGAKGIYRAVKLLCMILISDTYYSFFQMCKCTTPRVNANVNDGLWVLLCQGGFKDFPNVPLS